MFPPPNNEKDYPILKHTYNVASDPTNPEQIWLALSYKTPYGGPAPCPEQYRLFQVDVVP